jgi:1,2-dihydroxy-3-keto-5-methylthiopentene dioxygenase
LKKSILDHPEIASMSQLTVYAEAQPTQPLFDSRDYERICSELALAGVRFERWNADRPIAEDATSEDIIAAYQHEIDRLVAERGYCSWDVVSMHPAHPQKQAFRQKFLAEHTHGEDEVRFFVRGQGLFVMHVGEQVYALLCEKDDLVSVPANTRHWFDMGPNPVFTAIRLFNNPEGWVAHFTGSDIATRFPLLDN